MKKTPLRIIIFSLLLCSVAVAFYIFSPHPVLIRSEAVHIVKIQYNPMFNQEGDSLIEVLEYDEGEILDCLSQYAEQRTLSTATSYWLGDVEWEITIDTDHGLKTVVLGNDSYSYQSYGKPKFQISNANALKLELLELLQIPYTCEPPQQK